MRSVTGRSSTGPSLLAGTKVGPRPQLPGQQARLVEAALDEEGERIGPRAVPRLVARELPPGGPARVVGVGDADDEGRAVRGRRPHRAASAAPGRGRSG